MGRGLRSDEAMKVMGLVSLQEGRGDFPGGSVVKNPPAKAGDMGLIPNPRKWQPTPVVVPGKSHGRGDWWGCKRVRHN